VETNGARDTSLAFSLAAFTLSAASLAMAVRRGEITTADAADVVHLGQNSLVTGPPLVLHDPAVNQMAAKILELVHQIVRTYSAEKTPEGPH
jgi:hypothetical protein